MPDLYTWSSCSSEESECPGSMGETLSTELKKIRKAVLTWGRRKSRAVFSGPFGAPERISKQTKKTPPGHGLDKGRPPRQRGERPAQRQHSIQIEKMQQPGYRSESRAAKSQSYLKLARASRLSPPRASKQRKNGHRRPVGHLTGPRPGSVGKSSRRRVKRTFDKNGQRTASA